jgi:RNA recognition motif-containing protein
VSPDDVSVAMTGRPRRAKRLHVSNIPFRMTAEDLKWIFGWAGKVTDAEVITNEKGSKGFGFVTFEDESCAEVARTYLNGSTWDGRRIEINEAHPKQRYKVSPSPALLSASPREQEGFVKYMKPRHAIVQFGHYSTVKVLTRDMINSQMKPVSLEL